MLDRPTLPHGYLGPRRFSKVPVSSGERRKALFLSSWNCTGRRRSAELRAPKEEKLEKVDLTVDWSEQRESARERYWNQSPGSVEEKLSAFPKFCDRTALSRFLVKNEIFKRIAGVQGSIVECGVHFGGGLMTWANLSSLYEPLNHRRRIIGFDTFMGFPNVREQDKIGESKQAVDGGYCGGSVADLENAISLFDVGRPLAQLPKVHIVAGDFMKTCDAYLAQNPHLVISLLYLDFDIYEPTKHALEKLLPRVTRGGIVAFDELHVEEWPGETQALHEATGIGRTKLERMPFSSISWWQLD
jgi:hypothetical protein